jgi:tetratricopeptide (TPR) repeat protein
MAYLGNPSLSTAVKDRVGATFQQALALYRQGRMDDVLAGCELILKMDPLFDPAKKLVEKTRNPAAPIDVDQLVAVPSATDAMAVARQAMEARDFQRVLNITTEVLTNDLMNDEARILGDEAREKMEAAPFVDQFLAKCQQHIQSANLPAARLDLEKARALDAAHPAIAKMEKLVAGGPAAKSPPASTGTPSFDFGANASPSFIVDQPSSKASGRPADPTDFGFTFEEDKRHPPSGGDPFANLSLGSPAAAKPAPPASSKPAPDSPFGSFSFGESSPGAASKPDELSFATPEAPKPPETSFGSGFSFDPVPPPAAPKPAAPPGGFSFDAGASSGNFSFGEPASAPPATGFSFDSASPAASGGSFDFTTVPTETSADDQKRIEQYLADGDRAFSAGDLQQAIDLWSRIFLVDVTNEQASERIERAKARRREAEQRIEGLLATAIQTFSSKDFATARLQFEEILRIDPMNSTALDYMRRLQGQGSEPAPAAAAFENRRPAPGDLRDDDSLSYASAAESGTWGAEIPDAPPVVIPGPSPTRGRTETRETTTSDDRPKKSPMGLVGGVLALVVLLAGGWFAYSKFFARPAHDPATTQATLRQATALGQRGQYDRAIALLQDVKADDPQHDRALVMIADFQHKKSQSSEMIDGRPAATVFQENIDKGRAAFDAHDYLGATKAFETAARIRPLPPEVKQSYDASAQQVGKLDSALALFKEGKYQDAIAYLQQLTVQDPQNQNIKQLLLNAHFNLGAQALQADQLADAVKELDEVLKATPNDEIAKRTKELAQRYQNQPKDLLYRIYVKYLPLR